MATYIRPIHDQGSQHCSRDVYLVHESNSCLRAVDSWWEEESVLFKGVAHGKLFIFLWMAPYPCAYGEHKWALRGDKEKEEKGMKMKGEYGGIWDKLERVWGIHMIIYMYMYTCMKLSNNKIRFFKVDIWRFFFSLSLELLESDPYLKRAQVYLYLQAIGFFWIPFQALPGTNFVFFSFTSTPRYHLTLFPDCITGIPEINRKENGHRISQVLAKQ